MDLHIHPFWIALLQGLIVGGTLNAIFAFGEEIGWRGFLWNELKELGFFRASFLIGLIWGVWHSPLVVRGYNYPIHPKIGVILMIVFCILYTPLINYIRVKTGSVISCAIMHGTINGTGQLAFFLVKGGGDLTVGITGLAGLLVLFIGNVVLFSVVHRERKVLQEGEYGLQ